MFGGYWENSSFWLKIIFSKEGDLKSATATLERYKNDLTNE
jgi:hypothetical protein